MNKETFWSICNRSYIETPILQKISVSLVGIGLVILSAVWVNGQAINARLLLPISLICLGVGAIGYIQQVYRQEQGQRRGGGVFLQDITHRGLSSWLLGVVLTGFYVCLYWFPQYLSGLIALFEPMSQFLRHKSADQWFVYGSFYTISVLLMGIKMLYKYRHNRYQVLRTCSVIFFQVGFGFLLPAFLVSIQQPEIYFSYFWPLSYYQASPQAFELAQSTKLGLFYFGFGLVMFFIGTPILTYFYGKRWYCSWVCGCGGLAETAGDSFRHLSDKSLRAWKIERYMIYTVLILVSLMTVLLWINVATGQGILHSFSNNFYKLYAFWIGSTFSGVVGVGFYPLLGARIWCRFGCPMAAWLGIWQRYFSRFRITVNGGQCISCGNCSTYCEMGIDVKSYAQRGEDIRRASCVGCGICAEVCPRGVLRLENGRVSLDL